MRTIFLYTLARFRGQVLGWGLATFLMGVLAVIRYNIFQDNQELIRQLLAGAVGDLIRMFGDVTQADHSRRVPVAGLLLLPAARPRRLRRAGRQRPGRRG